MPGVRRQLPAVSLSRAIRRAAASAVIANPYAGKTAEDHGGRPRPRVGRGRAAVVVADAHLAALAVEHGLTLCSTDGDFGRFPGLRWENPIGSTGS